MTRSSEDARARAAESPPSRAETLLTWTVSAGAFGLSAFQVWQAVTGSIGATVMRPIHLTWVLALTFLSYPLLSSGSPARARAARFVDLGLAAAAVYCGFVIATFDYRSIDHILYGLTPHDLAVGVVFVLLLLEATRRSVGAVMIGIGGAFLLYNAYGNLLPDLLANRGFTLERIVRFEVYTGAGLFGTPLGIAAGTVFIFVVFGAFLEVTGAGRFFIDLAFAAAGRFRGGPAKASVVASAAMGSISGSAIANTVTTGALTIPMMKRLGYRPEQAAGIEAAASTGGQIMPPIMGAGAFIMAEFTNTPYTKIVLVSIAPALLYFLCTLLFVHFMAVREDLKGLAEPPAFGATLRAGAHFLLPLGAVTLLLLLDYSPPLVGSLGCAAVVLTGAVRARTRVGLRLLANGLVRGALMALPISAACATAGIVVGVIGQTGIGLQFTESVVHLAQGQLWLALVLIGAAALVLGMGLPVTAAYIVVSVVGAPALRELGVSLLAAHMIVFWLSQTSNVTPPIALAAFAGAGIAEARPLGAAVEAMKLAAGFFILPVMMAYSSLLFVEGVTLVDGAAAVVLTLAVIGCVAAVVEGQALGPLARGERLAFAVATALLVVPSDASRIAGLGLGAGALALHAARARAAPTSALVGTANDEDGA